tara:strand:- start:1790 stop:1987 length:198 start_codon:yes stop_codon:yes gene_type:complete
LLDQNFGSGEAADHILRKGDAPTPASTLYAFHPMVNTHTVFISYEELRKFLEKVDHIAEIINLRL